MIREKILSLPKKGTVTIRIRKTKNLKIEKKNNILEVDHTMEKIRKGKKIKNIEETLQQNLKTIKNIPKKIKRKNISILILGKNFLKIKKIINFYYYKKIIFYIVFFIN